MFSLKNRFRCSSRMLVHIFFSLVRYSVRLIKLKFQAVSWDVTHIELLSSPPKNNIENEKKNKFRTQVCLNKAKQHLCMENNTDSCAL